MRSLQTVAVVAVVTAVSLAQADITITQAGVWNVTARAKATACALGRCESASDTVEQDVYLPSGSIVQVAVVAFECGELALADYCTPAPRRKKIKFVKCDREILGEIFRSCTPYDNVRLRRVGGFEQVAADGKSFRWKSTVGLGIRTQGVNVALRVTAIVEGTWLAEAAVGAGQGEAGLPPHALVDAAVAAAVARALPWPDSP